MSREAPEISREEYARRWHALVDGLLTGPDVAPDPKWEREIEQLCAGPVGVIPDKVRLLMTWRPRECACSNLFRSYYHKERCGECDAADEERAKVEKIRRQVMKEFGIKPGAAESAGGGK